MYLFIHIQQLIPNEQTLKSPKYNGHCSLKSKQLNLDRKKCQHQQTPIQKTFQLQIIKLKQQINQLQLQKQANVQFTQIFTSIKVLLGDPSLKIEDLVKEVEKQLVSLNQEIKQLKTKQMTKQSSSQSDNQVKINGDKDFIANILKEKDQRIRELKQKLLESTQNNINAIFHSDLSTQQCLSKQIRELKNQIKRIQHQKYQTKSTKQYSTCPHHEKLSYLITNYEQMLQQYRKNQRIVQNLQEKQNQSYRYFAALKADLFSTLQNTCNKYSDDKMRELENRIEEALMGLMVPENVKTEEDNDVKVKELLNQIEKLNQKLSEKDIEIHSIVLKNQQDNGLRSWNSYRSKIDRLSILESQVQEKERKIEKLENTIIEQIQSKRKIQSFDELNIYSSATINSRDSDIDKQKNNVRNLKVIVSNLKMENKQLHQKLKEYEYEKSNTIIGGMKKKKNGQTINICESILNKLTGSSSDSCKCLNLVVNVMLNFQDKIPQLQDILTKHGFLEQSLVLIPAVDTISITE